jgi:hypothetical protein
MRQASPQRHPDLGYCDATVEERETVEIIRARSIHNLA